MYSVGMRIPTGTGAFVGGSQSFGHPAVPGAPAGELQLLENDLPGSCPARMRLPSSKLHRLPDGACGWQIEGRSAATSQRLKRELSLQDDFLENVIIEEELAIRVEMENQRGSGLLRLITLLNGVITLRIKQDVNADSVTLPWPR
jgi:hypothetical protein